MIVFNPVIPSQRQNLSQVLRWHNPDELALQTISDLHTASHGYVQAEITQRLEVDGCPVKADGFVYGAEDYYQRWQTRTGWHQPDGVDYGRILQTFDIIPKINSGQIDEVWLFGFPYAGFYESMMVGPTAFWCNAPPLVNGRAQRNFVIMGFNFERGVGEMLENFGHRTESIMKHVYQHKQGSANLWERFTRYEKTHPGQAECGNVHFAPNSLRDYDWGNSRPVLSRSHTWHNFPNLSGEPQKVTCAEWGNGDIRRHHLWWLSHLPHVTGSSGGILHNWWAYILDPNQT
jgi:hypothetical protein